MRGQNSGPLLSTVFIDYDNVYQSLKRKSDEAANRFAKDVSFWLSLIESGQLITSTHQTRHPQNRHLILNRCYGNPVPRRNSSDNMTDMNSFPFVRHHFLRAGLEIIDCPPLTSQLKNSAEIRIVMDVNDLMTHQTRFDEFIILSGDADFTPLLHRLRAHARRTVVYVNDLTAAPYAAIADGEIRESSLLEFLLQGREDLLEEVVSAETAEDEAPSLAYSGPQIEAIREEIISTIVTWVQSAGHPLALDSLAERITRTLGHERTLGTGWAGMGTLGALLHKGLPPTLRVSGQAPYFVYDICLPVGGDTSSKSQEGSRSQSSETQPLPSQELGSLKSSPNQASEKVGPPSLESSSPHAGSETSAVSPTGNTAPVPAPSVSAPSVSAPSVSGPPVSASSVSAPSVSASSVSASSISAPQETSSVESSPSAQTAETSTGSVSSAEASPTGFSHVTLFQPQLPFAPQPQPSTYPAQLSQLAYAAQFVGAPAASSQQPSAFITPPPQSAPYSPPPVHVSYGAPAFAPSYPAPPPHTSYASQSYGAPYSSSYSGPYSAPGAPSYIPHQSSASQPSFAPLRGSPPSPYSGSRPPSVPPSSPTHAPYPPYPSHGPVGGPVGMSVGRANAGPVNAGSVRPQSAQAPYTPLASPGRGSSSYAAPRAHSQQQSHQPYAPYAPQSAQQKPVANPGYASSPGYLPHSSSSVSRSEIPSSSYGSKNISAGSSSLSTSSLIASQPSTPQRSITPQSSMTPQSSVTPQPSITPQPFMKSPLLTTSPPMPKSVPPTFVPPSPPPPLPKAASPSPDTAAAVQKSITRIQNACEVPALAPPEYRILFEVMAQEITANGLSGAQTLANISQRAAEQSVKVRRDDIRFVLEVVSEADPWFEQGASADIFSSRFRNFVITRCRNKDLQLTSAEIDLIDSWFGSGSNEDNSALGQASDGSTSPASQFDSLFETSSSSLGVSLPAEVEEKAPIHKRGRKRA